MAKDKTDVVMTKASRELAADPQRNVLSVFAFGTGESRTMKKKNIVSQFSEYCDGDKLVINGPGVLGREVVEHVNLAIKHILVWLNQCQTDCPKINLMGFSRGAVTTIRIANRLKALQSNSRCSISLRQKLKNLECHIFAQDPVAGLSDKSDHEARLITDNVKSYVASLQCHEMRRDFRPQDLTRVVFQDPAKTQAIFLPMLGNHSGTLKIRNAAMNDGPHIQWQMLHHFLLSRGTYFRGDKLPPIVYSQNNLMAKVEVLPAVTLLKHFSSMHYHREAYIKSGNRIKVHDGIPIARKLRSFNQHLKFYVKAPEFFHNKLERELFKISYPKVFNYLFENNMLDPRCIGESAQPVNSVIEEAKKLKINNPQLFLRLQEAKLVFLVKGEIQVGSPRGINQLEDMKTLLLLNPVLLPEKLRKPIATKARDLAAEVVLLTFRYEREKSQFDVFNERAQHHLAHELREKVYEIEVSAVSNQSLIEVDKIKSRKILDLAQHYYQKLVRVNSKSQLREQLKTFLAKHGRHFIVKHQYSFKTLALAPAYLLFGVRKILDFTVGRLFRIGEYVVSGIGSELMALAERGEQVFGYSSLTNAQHSTTSTKQRAKNFFSVLVSVLFIFIGVVGSIVKHKFGLGPLVNGINVVLNKAEKSLIKASGTYEMVVSAGRANREKITNTLFAAGGQSRNSALSSGLNVAAQSEHKPTTALSNNRELIAGQAQQPKNIPVATESIAGAEQELTVTQNRPRAR